MSETYTHNSIIRRTTDQLSCDMAGEAVVLHMQSGLYFGLQDTAALIWDLLDKPRTFREIRDAIVSECNIDEATCEQDLRSFLDQMQAAALVEVDNGSYT